MEYGPQRGTCWWCSRRWGGGAGGDAGEFTRELGWFMLSVELSAQGSRVPPPSVSARWRALLRGGRGCEGARSC